MDVKYDVWKCYDGERDVCMNFESLSLEEAIDLAREKTNSNKNCDVSYEIVVVGWDEW
jgi:hypothetical protein